MSSEHQLLEGRDILIFGEDWGRFPSTTQHIGKVLLEKNRVMWVGSLGHRKPRFVWADAKRVFEKVKNMLFAVEVKMATTHTEKTSVESPILIHPFWIPWHDNAIIRALNKWSLSRRLKKELSNHQFNDVVVITSTPLVASVLPTLPVRSSHYLCLDDYSEFDDAFDALLIQEKKLLEQVDTTFAISDVLVSSKKPHKGVSWFITQGVDTRHFDAEQRNVPEQLREVTHPVVGFFGLVSEWVDIELIVFAASKLPEVTFVVIGRSTVDIRLFEAYPNIIYTGLVPYEQLPEYAKVFDVGSIPFKVNDLTIACNPLKMFEYFSLGIPVVSTALPEVEKFEPHVLVAHNPEQYVQLLNEAIALNTATYRTKMRALAGKYSWEAITSFISLKIKEAEHAQR